MADSENGDDYEWYELLPDNPLFQELSLANRDLPKDICEIRGDVFAWNDRDKVLLTTNLKRLAGKQEQKYQQLNCTRRPEGCVLRLLPEPSGLHVALQCERELSVVRLFRLRGEHGEFGGGERIVTCKVTQIATRYFHIYGDQFTLVHAAWHLTSPGVLVLLTSDNVIRLFNIANPNDPLVEIPLLASTTVGVYFKSHGYTLDDPFVSFSLWKNSVFAIRDNGEVYIFPLVSRSGDPPEPLCMHPQADDNYPGDPTSLLVLPTTPCALIIANSSGVLHHCLYFEPEEEEEAGDESSGQSSRMLYVVERIRIECQQTETTKLLLEPDPVENHTYYVIHPSGVHQVTLPWLSHLESYATSDVDIMPEAESKVTNLINTSAQGMVVLHEPLLGHIVIVTTSDGGVLSLPLQEYMHAYAEDHHQSIAGPGPTPHRPLLEHHYQSEFEKRVYNILHPPGEESAPVIRSSAGSGELSQEECYKFLVTVTKQVNRKTLFRHKDALEAIRERIRVLSKQKEILISSYLKLQDEAEELKTHTERLEEKVVDLAKMHKGLMVRMQHVVYRVESQSPVISEAENCMSEELTGLKNHLEGRMTQKMFEARKKLQLCRDVSDTPVVSLSQQQTGTILKTLTESGEYIKNLMKQVQSLREATPT